MAARVKKKPTELRDQLAQCVTAINALGAGWPTAAPTKVQVQAAHDDLATAITDADAAEATWKTKNQTRNMKADAGYDIATRVLQGAVMLYGANGAELLNFGFDPGGHLPDLHKLTQIKIADGILPGSILLDWENIQGATFEVQWFTDAALTQMIGSAASTRSDFTVTGLTSGQQYWLHVRPHRGGQTAPWSDPATRVAPV